MTRRIWNLWETEIIRPFIVLWSTETLTGSLKNSSNDEKNRYRLNLRLKMGIIILPCGAVKI